MQRGADWHAMHLQSLAGLTALCRRGLGRGALLGACGKIMVPGVAARTMRLGFQLWRLVPAPLHRMPRLAGCLCQGALPAMPPRPGGIAVVACLVRAGGGWAAGELLGHLPAGMRLFIQGSAFQWHGLAHALYCSGVVEPEAEHSVHSLGKACGGSGRFRYGSPDPVESVERMASSPVRRRAAAAMAPAGSMPF